MLTPSELEQIPLEFRKILTDAEFRIMEDIIRRIKINGEITRSADWQINRMMELGESRKVVSEILKRTLELSYTELDKIYNEVIESGYARNEAIYKRVDTEFIPYKKNEELQQMVQAVKDQTKDTIKNITQTTGFVINNGGKTEFINTVEGYHKILDNAMTDINTGTFDYNTVIKRTIKELTRSGIRTAGYESGRSLRIESAVRMTVMTGITQVTGKINDMNAEALGTNFFETSWHATARPEHQVWQGRVYSKQELIDICGLNSVSGLCGANCRHSYYSFIPGISKRTYTDEQLDQMNAKENKPKSYKGKKYTSYEATQRQRLLERLMRSQKLEIKLLNEGGADKEDIINAKSRYRSLSSQYTDFSKEMDLPQERQRLYVGV